MILKGIFFFFIKIEWFVKMILKSYIIFIIVKQIN